MTASRPLVTRKPAASKPFDAGILVQRDQGTLQRAHRKALV
jgi:hypothetical protein